jgi:hypothetical protein
MRTALISLCPVAILLLRSVPAQDTDAPRPALTAEEQARQRMVALEETMNRLAGLLESTEPASAQRLREAYAQAREAFITRNMEAIVDLLRDGKLESALARHGEVSTALRELLAILQAGAMDPDARRQELERLRKLADRLEQLEQEERAQQAATDAMGETADADQREAAAREQAATRERTEQLAGEMAAAESGTPGTDATRQAAGSMGAAEGSLQAGQCQSAAGAQQKAADQLAEARRQVEERIQELRNQEQQDVLLDLQALFKEMLEIQRRLTQETERTDIRLGPAALRELTRKDRLTIAGLARGEHGLEADALDGKEALEEEGTAAVFPFVLQLLIGHLQRAARGLEEEDTGEPTRKEQRRVEEMLEEMLATLDREIGARQQQPGGGGT